MNAASPLVSIVVPTFNAADYLPELCASLQAQTMTDFEVIVVDDGSTDHTQKALAQFGSDPRFRLFAFERNHGVGRSTLMALQQVRGEFWCYPGADDVLLPSFLEKRMAALRACPEAALVHGRSVPINERGETIPDPNPDIPLPAYMPGPEALSLLLQHNYINTPTILIRQAVTRMVLPFYSTGWFYAQDWFLWILHAASGWAFLFDEARLTKYRIHSQSLTYSGRLAALRQAEIRLVPLCALSAAALYAHDGALAWARWRQTLYTLWIRRALHLARAGALEPHWMVRAATAYYGRASRSPSLLGECVFRLPAMLRMVIREKAARRRQRFPVGGVAEIDHPLFRNG